VGDDLGRPLSRRAVSGLRDENRTDELQAFDQGTDAHRVAASRRNDVPNPRFPLSKTTIGTLARLGVDAGYNVVTCRAI
jgi:hypothetical protein